MASLENQRLIIPSTYTLLIAETVLGQYEIHLNSQKLLEEIQNPNSIYSIIIQAPSLNILNQLIFSQILSYQHYIQKKFIDYFTKYATLDENDNEEAPVHSETIQELKNTFILEKNASREVEQNLFDQIAYVNQIILSMIYHQSLLPKALDNIDKHKLVEKITPCVENAKILRQTLIELRAKWKNFATDFTERFAGAVLFQTDELTDLELRAELEFFQDLGRAE